MKFISAALLISAVSAGTKVSCKEAWYTNGSGAATKYFFLTEGIQDQEDDTKKQAKGIYVAGNAEVETPADLKCSGSNAIGEFVLVEETKLVNVAGEIKCNGGGENGDTKKAGTAWIVHDKIKQLPAGITVKFLAPNVKVTGTVNKQGETAAVGIKAGEEIVNVKAEGEITIGEKLAGCKAGGGGCDPCAFPCMLAWIVPVVVLVLGVIAFLVLGRSGGDAAEEEESDDNSGNENEE